MIFDGIMREEHDCITMTAFLRDKSWWQMKNNMQYNNVMKEKRDDAFTANGSSIGIHSRIKLEMLKDTCRIIVLVWQTAH